MQQDTKPDNFHEFRMTGIGGTDISCILGLNKYRSAAEVWAEKKGIVPSSDRSTEATQWGLLLESTILEEAARRCGASITTSGGIQIRSAGYSFAIGNIDALAVVNQDTQVPMFTQDETGKWQSELVSLKAGQLLVLDAKNSRYESRYEDGLPIEYECQGRWYMPLAQASQAVFACLIGGQELRLYRILHDDAIYQDMLQAAEAFWESLDQDEMPLLSDAPVEVIRKLKPVIDGSSVVADSYLEDLIRRWDQAKKQQGELSDLVDSLRREIEALCGTNQIVDCPNLGLQVVRSAQIRTTYEVPEEVKKQYPPKVTVVNTIRTKQLKNQ
jgi:predicted phage-related endonuclease